MSDYPEEFMKIQSKMNHKQVENCRKQNTCKMRFSYFDQKRNHSHKTGQPSCSAKKDSPHFFLLLPNKHAVITKQFSHIQQNAAPSA